MMISSYDLARNADIVFSEVIELNQFQKLESNNLKIIKKDSEKVFYITKNLKIFKNATIFTHTDFLLDLFKVIKKLPKNFNLNIVSHQSDLLINEKIYKLKPNCVEKWFAINVDFSAADLIPIPLGLANKFSNKNIQPLEIKNLKNKFNIIKSNLLYVNFEINTNKIEREYLYKKFDNKSWVKIDKPNLTKDEYINNISSSEFLLCPWGNGIDTHRIWESLLIGSIPITKKHTTFSYSKELPILFVDNFDQVTEANLLNFKKNINLKNYNLDKLTQEYWIKYIFKKNANKKEFKIIKNNVYRILFKSKIKTIFKKIIKISKTPINYTKKYIKKLIKK